KTTAYPMCAFSSYSPQMTKSVTGGGYTMALLIISLFSTFSIAAYDADAGEWGVAVASCVPFAYHSVAWAEAGVGAVATQSWTNHFYGTDGLALLGSGLTADSVVFLLTAGDSLRDQRQLGIVDRYGNTASFTGEGCADWAGSIQGDGYTIQGNILTGPEVVTAMEEAFLETESYPLAERLYASLVAGEAAGGDSRGRQSAGILVVREGSGHDGATDRFVELVVNDNPDPLVVLGAHLYTWELYNCFPVYASEMEEDPISEQRMIHLLQRLAYEGSDNPQLLNLGAWELAIRDLMLDEAVEMALKAVELAPEDFNIRDTLAEALFRNGDTEGAVEQALVALELDPENIYLQEQLERFSN
ncbi:MAG: DUF1028 domain-containing protein, partial [Candidatus Sabulitectum sp.]|nr:DUF1028 domain-containing protein [Candidatus Sabulitectum sp.]